MLLAIDTCGSTGTIALASREGERITALGTAELAGKTYSAMLMPRLRELMEMHNAGLRQIEVIIIVNGPGSFTGVRVGVSAVKGLAEVFSTRVIAVSRLHVLAQKAKARFTALDAGRGEFYFRDDNAAKPIEAVLSLDELQTAIPAGNVAVCEEKTAAYFPDAVLVPPPTASDALAVALTRLLSADFDDITTLDGNYLRRADAEVKSGVLVGKTK